MKKGSLNERKQAKKRSKIFGRSWWGVAQEKKEGPRCLGGGGGKGEEKAKRAELDGKSGKRTPVHRSKKRAHSGRAKGGQERGSERFVKPENHAAEVGWKSEEWKKNRLSKTRDALKIGGKSRKSNLKDGQWEAPDKPGGRCPKEKREFWGGCFST